MLVIGRVVSPCGNAGSVLLLMISTLNDVSFDMSESELAEVFMVRVVTFGIKAVQTPHSSGSFSAECTLSLTTASEKDNVSWHFVQAGVGGLNSLHEQKSIAAAAIRVR
jgi:hypothetical protein